MYKCPSLSICVSYLFVCKVLLEECVCLSVYLSVYPFCLFVGWQRRSVSISMSVCLSIILFIRLFVYLFVCRVSEEECDEDFLPSPMSRYRQLLFASLKFCLAILTSLGIENQDCGNQVSRLRCKMLGAKTGEQTRVSDSWHENLKLRTLKTYFAFMKS